MTPEAQAALLGVVEYQPGNHQTPWDAAYALAQMGDKVPPQMQQRLLANPKVEMLWHHTLEEALGEGSLESVRVRDVRTGADKIVPARGLFYAIGHVPNTAFLKGQLTVDETGYVITKPGTTQTSVPGVFAAGDVQDKRWRQAITAAGTGCMAALEAEAFLQGH